ncbi:hypothetical protein JYU19_01700 [bacterium AH-315-J21]|nr:hypothetical protein [bacterium AH-315-J21]
MDSKTEIEQGTNFWRLLEVMALQKRLILTLVTVATGAAIVAALVLPKWYRAEALLLPPKEESFSVLNSGSAIAEWASVTGGLNLPALVTPSDLYVRMLGSRASMDPVIEKFHLLERFEAKSLSEAYATLKKRADFRVTPEGMIQIRFADKEPQFAADVTNAFVEELDKINRRIYSSRTKKSREFIQSSLGSAKLELDSARVALRSFQELNHTVDLDRQTGLAIETAAALKTALATAEVELALKQRTLSDSHPDVVELATKVEVMQGKVLELEVGSGSSSYFSLPIAEAPRLRSQLANLTTRVRVAEQVYESLTLALNDARVQENRQAPAVATLDRATAPQIRYKPQRTLIVGAAFGLSFVIAVFLALLVEYLKNLKHTNPEDYRRALVFSGSLLGSKNPKK